MSKLRFTTEAEFLISCLPGSIAKLNAGYKPAQYCQKSGSGFKQQEWILPVFNKQYVLAFKRTSQDIKIYLYTFTQGFLIVHYESTAKKAVSWESVKVLLKISSKAEVEKGY